MHTVQGEGDGVHEPEEEIGRSIVSIITKCISKSGRKELGMKHANILLVFVSQCIVMQHAAWCKVAESEPLNEAVSHRDVYLFSEGKIKMKM